VIFLSEKNKSHQVNRCKLKNNVSNNRKSIIYALIAVLLWSTVATSFKISLNYLSPALTLFYSVFFTLIVLFVILLFQKKTRNVLPTNSKEWLYSMFLGLLNPFLYYLILFKAYSLLPAQLAQPLNYTWPLMLVLLSVPILGNKIGIKSLLAILVSFLGVIFISFKDKFSLDFDSPLGILLATGSSLIWALFWLYSIKDTRDEIIKLFTSFAFGFFYILIYVFIAEDFILPPTEGFFATIYIGLFEMGITFVLWLTAMKCAESTDKIANLVYISPFLSLFFIHFLLGEQIFITTLVGLILILCGIIIQNYRWSKKTVPNLKKTMEDK
jgi:drug/metabolite transporter (DMT)-like permease